MKKTAIAAIFLIFTAFSCGKDDPPPAPGATVYMSMSANSTRNYDYIDNTVPAPGNTTNYTVTSTNRDTTVGTRSYHVFTSSLGDTEYYNVSGSDYYTFQPLPAGMGNNIENLYLKTGAAVNETWSQSFNIDVQGVIVPVTVTNKIIEKGISRSVNSITYSDVIHVSTSISSALIPASALQTAIHSYYAPRVGLIQNTTEINLNYMGITDNTSSQTILKSAVIL